MTPLTSVTQRLPIALLHTAVGLQVHEYLEYVSSTNMCLGKAIVSSDGSANEKDRRHLAVKNAEYGSHQ